MSSARGLNLHDTQQKGHLDWLLAVMLLWIPKLGALPERLRGFPLPIAARRPLTHSYGTAARLRSRRGTAAAEFAHNRRLAEDLRQHPIQDGDGPCFDARSSAGFAV